jgi:hypothetical protein
VRTIGALLAVDFLAAVDLATVADGFLTAAVGAFLAGAVPRLEGAVFPPAQARAPKARAAAKVIEFMIVEQCIRKLSQKTASPQVNSIYIPFDSVGTT